MLIVHLVGVACNLNAFVVKMFRRTSYGRTSLSRTIYHRRKTHTTPRRNGQRRIGKIFARLPFNASTFRFRSNLDSCVMASKMEKPCQPMINHFAAHIYVYNHRNALPKRTQNHVRLQYTGVEYAVSPIAVQAFASRSPCGKLFFSRCCRLRQVIWLRKVKSPLNGNNAGHTADWVPKRSANNCGIFTRSNNARTPRSTMLAGKSLIEVNQTPQISDGGDAME